MSKTALITGPTSGIGYELTKCFATDGYGLALVARNSERLLEMKSDFEKRCRLPGAGAPVAQRRPCSEIIPNG